MSEKYVFGGAEVVAVGVDPHVCVVVPPFEPVMPIGSILRCDCGRYYERIADRGDNWGHPWWREVRWWHRATLRRIRESEVSS